MATFLVLVNESVVGNGRHTVDGSEIRLYNHLGCKKKHGKSWDIYHINCCGISAINSITEK